MRENLAEVGIDLEVIPLDRSAFIPRVFTDRDFDMNIISYCKQYRPCYWCGACVYLFKYRRHPLL